MREESTIPFKMPVYRVLVFKNSIQKGQIFIGKSSDVLDYTHFNENGHPEG